jgi:hypothetical protein
VFRIMEPTVPWYTRHLIWAYPWTKVGLLPFIDSVSSEVSLAAWLGYDPIFMIGVDYGGPRFRQSIWKDGAWEIGPTSGVVPPKFVDTKGKEHPDIPWGTSKGAGGLESDPGMTYAVRGLLIAAFMKVKRQGNPARIYQMSKPSNITQFPFVPFDEVLSSQGKSFPLWDEQKVAEDIEVALAASDTFMIPVNSGFGTDYRVYMMHPSNIVQALSDLNVELLTNKQDLRDKEKSTGMSVREQIEKGVIVVESGELMIHNREDLKDFSLDNMRGIDVESTAAHLRKVYDKSREKIGE